MWAENYCTSPSTFNISVPAYPGCAAAVAGGGKE